MKKLILLIVLQLSLFAVFGQKKGLNYQAVILDPNTIEVPGIAVTGQPLSNGKVWIRFTLKSSAGVDYEEIQQTTTDEFGLISLTVGNGTTTLSNSSTASGISKFSSFDSIVWDSELKSLLVAVNFDGGTKFTKVSDQKLNFTPYALYAETVDYKNIRDSPKNLSQFNNDSGYLVPKDLDPLKTNIATNAKAIADNQSTNEGKFLVVNQTIEALDKQVKADITNINNTLTDHDNRINLTNTKLTNTTNTLTSQIGYVQNITESTATTVSNLSGTYESAANKSAATDLGGGSPSDVLYPTQRAAKTYVDNAVSIAVASGAPDATTLASGKVQLTGDLGGTATNPTVPGLANKENVSNKSTSVTTDATSDTKYPSVHAVKTYVDQATQGIALQAAVDAKADRNSPIFTGTPSMPTGTTAVTQSAANNTTAIATTAFVQGLIASATIVDADATTKGKLQLAGDLGGTAASPTVPGLANKEDVANKSTTTTLGSSNTLYPTQNAVKIYVDNQVAAATIADADATTKGKLQLAGDLTGTAASPSIATGAITSTKIADGTIATADIANDAITTAKITDANVTDAKIAGVSGSKVTGNISGNAANVTGTVAVANGGTGATTASAALTNLGAQASANLSTDMTADATSLTKYPAVSTIKDYVDNSVAAATIADATTSLKGKIQLGGDLAGTGTTAAAPVISDNAITTVKITDANVTTAKLATNAVTTAKITDANVTTAKLADNSVTTVKITDANVTTGKLADDAVTTIKITDANVTTAKLADNVVTTLKITDANVTTSKLADNAVTTVKITDANVTTAKLADNAVTTLKITDANVTTAKLANGSVTTAKIADASVTNAKIAETITIANGGTGATTASAALTSIGAQATANISTNMTADSASTSKYPSVKTIKNYVDATVVSATPDADATTKGKIQLAGDLTGTAASPAIATGAITSAKIADGTIATADIAGDAITSTKILDGTIVNADISSSAAIADSKLATIATSGKVSNSATTATNSNTASAIVARDSNGDFTAGTISANLTGLATKATNINGGAIGAIPYQNAANTTSLLTGNTAATKKFLAQTGDGTASAAPVWAGVAVADISGTLPVANGGTGVTTVAANLVFAGPTSGASAAAPSFRSLVAADLPSGSTNYVINGTTQQASTDFNISGSGTIGTTLDVTGNTTIGGTATITGATTLSALTASKGVFSDASKRLTSTGTLGTDQGGTGMTSFNNGGAMYATSTSALTTGTLPTSAGGTGLTSYTSGGALYTTSTTAITSGTLPISAGGTGATTKTAAFDALSPMTTAGDIIYGGTSGSGSRLAKGTDGQFLTLTSGVPAWTSITSGTSSLAAIGSVPNANGASISSSTLTLQPANATYGGVVTTATQTFAGAKTFNNNVEVVADLLTTGTSSAYDNTNYANKNALIIHSYNQGGSIGNLTSLVATGSSSGDWPSNINFLTRPLTGVPTEVMRITKDGRVGIGNTAPAYTLDVTGTTRITGITSLTNTTSSTSTSTGALTVAGGAGIAGTMFVGGDADFTSSSASSSTTTGAVVVTGGVGIGKSINAAEDSYINGVRIGRGGGSVLNNTVVGLNTMGATATGAENTAIGNQALLSLTSGTNNTSVGSESSKSLTVGLSNVALGYRALTGSNNAQYNAVVGANALMSLSSAAVNERNSVVGMSTLSQLTQGSRNSAFGQAALYWLNTGSYNTALGANAGSYSVAATQVTAADQSVFVGAETKPLAATSTNEIVIGYNAVGLGNNTTAIGNLNMTNAKIWGALNLPNTTTSTSTTTGALTVGGGVGIAGTMYVGGAANITGATTLSDLTATKGVFTDASKRLTSTGTLGTDQGGSGMTSFNSGGAMYATSTSALTTGTLPTSAGGTGLTSYTSGGALYTTSTTAITSGTLPISAGGTGATTKTDAFDALSPMTTAGDIIYGGTSGSGTRLGVGTNGQVLTLASGAPAWTSLPSSGVTTLAAIGSVPNANGASISSTTLNLQPASAGYGGVVTTAAQTFAGAKTFNNNVEVVADLITTGTSSAYSNTNYVDKNALVIHSYNEGGIGNLVSFVATGNSTQNWNSNINFLTRPISGVPTEAMRITKDGRVGIGNSAPTNTLDVTGTTRITGITSLTNTTTSTSTSTGALTVAGGAGIAGTMFVGGDVDLTSTTTSTSTTTGALTIAGGTGIAGTLVVGGNANFTSTTASSSTTTGALVVTGGMGIGKSINAGEDSYINGVRIGRGGGSIEFNTAVGLNALSATASGAYNTGVGNFALTALTSGARNVAIGSESAKAITTGADNLAIGNQALKVATNSNYNIAVGSYALSSLSDLTTNDRNLAIGGSSLSFLTAGQYNVALGTSALYNLASGSSNVGVGRNAGLTSSAASAVTASNQSVFLGTDSKPLAATSTNEIVIGYNAVGLGNNTTAIGNSSMTNAKIWGALNLPNTTTSTSTTTGALTVGGGVGIAGTMYVGGDVDITSTTTSTSTTTGAFNVAGGAGIAGTMYVGGDVDFTSSSAATSTTTGALVVTGGVGIGGATYIGGNTAITGTIKIAGGTPGLGKVLTSDANGLATWSNNGGGGVLSKTASYAILTTDNSNVVVFSGSTASQTITLPSAVTVGAGREITVKNIASVSVAVAVVASGGYLISDSTTTTATGLNIGIEPSNNWIKAISDGTNWIILRALF